MIVLDTNVVSELMKSHPDPVVADWVRATDDQFFITTITIGEIFYGLERLPKGRRRSRLQAVAEEVFDDFGEFVLPFEAGAARRYGALVADRERRGKPISTEDAQIAAICQSTGLDCATRNTGDFDDLDLRLIDPWESGRS